MAPWKQTVTLNGARSKGKAINAIGGMVLPPAIDQPYTTEDTVSSPHGATANVQARLPQYEDQIFQMLVDMKE